jgi:hypothetical protein
VGEQPGERPDVLVVVADDVDQRLDRAAAQERQVVPRDLPALDVADAVQAEQLGLGRPEPGIAEPMAEEPPHDRQEVEVAVVRRRWAARHPEPGHEQRPVEAPPVVGDEPRALRDRRGRARSASPAPPRGRAAAAGPA